MSFDLESNAESERLLNDSNTLHLKVRTKEGSELEVALKPTDLVNDLKQAITSRLQLVDKHIRLIFSGKLLEPPSALLSSFKLIDGSYVHAVITNQSQHTPISTEAPSSSSASRIDLTNLRGLDTLMLPGPQRSALSIDEVASLRSYFHDDIVEYTQENIQRASGESDVDFIYRCETEWMNAQDARSEFRLNLFGTSLFSNLRPSLHPSLLTLNQGSSSGGVRALQMSFNDDVSGTPSDQGTMREFLCGLLMGFGCGYMMLFCMWDRNISQRQKLGILVGMVLSLMLTMTMQDQDPRESSASGKQIAGKTQQEVPEIPVIDGNAGGMGMATTTS
jgi:hypothetical protein